MAVSNDLFELITSLSKSEKRYFRMFASLNARGGSSRYLQLFDLIDAQNEYDEQQIRAAFARKFAARHFSETKYYLYNAILRSLHMYSAEQSVDVQITATLHQALILFDRKLFRQSEKLVARAREQAIENERWHLAVDAQHVEYQIEDQKGISPQQMEALLARIFQHDDLWRDRLEQWAVYVRMLARIRVMGQPRNSEQLAAFSELLHYGREQNMLQAESPMAAIYRFYSRAVLQQASGDYRGAAESYRSILPMIETSTYWKKSGQLPITSILYNICMLSIKARDAESFRKHYPVLMERTDKSPRSAHHELHISSLALQTEFHLMMGDYHEALAASAELERALIPAESNLTIPVRAHVMALLLSVHFGLGKYSQCIGYLNIIFAMKREGLPVYRYRVARMYQLMIHFERGDYDLLEHLLRSAHRDFVAGRSGYKAESVIIAFIKRALRSSSRSEWTGLFSSLYDEIIPLLDDPFERSFLNWVDLVSWLESRTSGRPYAEIRQERARKGKEGQKPSEAEEEQARGRIRKHGGIEP